MIAAPHLSRPRLVSPLRDHAVVAVEAGGGAGKTSLALELAQALDAAPVLVHLDPDAETMRGVLARTREVLQRSGMSRAAEVAGAAGDVAGLVAALDAVDDAVLLVLDDVHHVGAGLVDELSAAIATTGQRHRVAVCGRRLPVRLGPGVPTVTDVDLALTPEEAVELGRLLQGGGSETSATVALAVRAVTAGWMAPTVAALTAGHQDARSAMLSVRAIVDDVLQRLDPEHLDRVAQLAHLPRFDERVVAAVGATAALRRAQDVGLPLRRLGGAWAVIANPFADELAEQVPFHREERQRAAAAFADGGDALLAAELVRRHDGDVAAAALLTAVDGNRLLRVHGRELVDLVTDLDDAAVREHPDVLLVGSAMAAQISLVDVRRDLVDRLLQVTEGTDAAPLALAEDLHERVWRHPDPSGIRDELLELERRVDDGDLRIQARLAEVRVRLLTMLHGEDRDEVDAGWAHAVRCWSAAGQETQAARATTWRALQGAWAFGRYEDALELLSRAVTLAGAASSPRLVALCYRGMVLVDMGRYAEAERTFGEAAGLAHALRADVRRAHVAWFRARMASQQGDAAQTLAHVREAEAADVTDAGGGVFFAADAATLLARVGLHDEVEARLAHAVAHDPGGSEKVPLAAMDVAARRGDLEEALAWHARLDGRQPVEARSRWWVRLLLAWAAQQVGDGRARAWAVEAFELAGTVGLETAPFVREPAIARDLVELAAEGGSTVARGLLDAGIATVRTLGEFAVDLPGAPGTSLGGKEAVLVKYLAAVGGRAAQEAVIEMLWPEAEVGRGRARLRVVLSRLKGVLGDVVVREGDALTFADGVVVDAVRFDDLAQRALVGGDLGLAEAAVSAYGGTFLPDDPYESWADGVRDRLEWRYLALLDRLAAAAEHQGDLERALTLLYVGIDAEPTVEDRYVLAARLLCEQSRTSRARALLERCLRTLRAQDLRPTRDLLALLEMLQR